MVARNLQGSKRGLPHQTAESPNRVEIPGRSGPSLTSRPQTTAQGVVASLALPAARPASPQPVSPLPLTGLHRLPRDASMLYDIGRVDGSGRIASNDIINALRWQPGQQARRNPDPAHDRHPRGARRPVLRSAKAVHHHPVPRAPTSRH